MITRIVLFALMLLSVPSWAFSDSGIVFIANKNNSVNSLSVRDLVEFYRKEKREWPNGLKVRFVDQAPNSPERKIFLNRFLKQSPSDVDLYWFGQKLRSGNSMPIQVSSDAMVIEIVKAIVGAVGYVSATTNLGEDGVKRLKVSDMPKK